MSQRSSPAPIDGDRDGDWVTRAEQRYLRKTDLPKPSMPPERMHAALEDETVRRLREALLDTDTPPDGAGEQEPPQP